MEDINMNKLLKKILIFILGLINGSRAVFLIIDKYDAEISEAKKIFYIKDLETLAFHIYNTGEYESSVIILRYLIDKLHVDEDMIEKPNFSENLKLDFSILQHVPKLHRGGSHRFSKGDQSFHH